jgi:AcrR family transcriptional regulator
VRAGALASRQALVQAAIALWRTKGFEATTVTDICKAAGVSKALFYVYFSRKEDVLFEAEIFTIRDAHAAAQSVTVRPYELVDLIAAVVETLIRRTRRFPPDLVFESVIQSYRLERLALSGGGTEADLAFLFLEPFEQAGDDGKFRAGISPMRAARIAQSLVSDGIRRWAASEFAERDIAKVIATDIAELWGDGGVSRVSA